MGVTELIPEKGGAGGFRVATEAAQKKVTNVNIYQLIGNALNERLRHLSSATLMQRQAETMRFMKVQAPKIYEFYSQKPNFSGTALDLSIEEGTAELFRGVMAQKALGPLRQQIVPKLNGKGSAGQELDSLIFEKLPAPEQKKLWQLIQSGNVDMDSVLSEAELARGKRVTERVMAGETLTQEELSQGYLYLRSALRTSFSEKQADVILRSLGEHAQILDSSIAFGFSGAIEVPRWGMRALASDVVDATSATRLSAFMMLPARIYATFKFRAFKSDEITAYMNEVREKYLSEAGKGYLTVGSLGRKVRRALPVAGAMVIASGVLFGIGYGVYRLVSSGKAEVAPGTVSIDPGKDAYGSDVADEFKTAGGKKLIFEGRFGKQYAVNFTTEIRHCSSEEEEQKRVIKLLKELNHNPIFSEQIKKNTLPIENVPMLIGVLYELQKSGLDSYDLRNIALNISRNYDSAFQIELAKDIANFLRGNPKKAKEIEILSADPYDLNSKFGKNLKKEYKANAAWIYMPFDVFLVDSPIFDGVKMPNFPKDIPSKEGKSLPPLAFFSEQIKTNFDPKDQKEVAKGFDMLYRKMANKGGMAKIPDDSISHLMYVKEMVNRGFSVGQSFGILLEIENNVNPVATGAGALKNLSKNSKSIVLGKLLESINKDTPIEDMRSRLKGILLDSDKRWTNVTGPLFNEVEVTPLMNFLDQTKLNDRQKEVVITAARAFFNRDFQLWLLEGVVPKKGQPEGIQLAQVAARLTPGMTDSQIIDEIHALGFERGRNWTTPEWDTYLDPELKQYFEETDAKRLDVAKRQHMALTNTQYLEERQLLIDFADLWREKNRTGAIPTALLLAKAKQAFIIEREAATRDLDRVQKLELISQSIEPKELDARVKSIESGAGEKKEEPKRRRHRRHHRHR